jgi:hypothetical protein
LGEALLSTNRDNYTTNQWLMSNCRVKKRSMGNDFRNSAKVAAAQDLLALNIDLSSIMQAGRCTDTRMPMRYGERVLAARGGMARAAKEQERG